VRPQLAGQQPGQRGQHRAIRPRQPRPADLPAQHGHLMPQHHDLDVLRSVGPGQQRQPADNPHQAQVQHPHRHSPGAWTSAVRACVLVVDVGVVHNDVQPASTSFVAYATPRAWS